MSRVALVTGGASGIGYGIAEHLLRAGHRVAILDRRAEAAQRPGAVGHVVDVRDRSGVDAAVSSVRTELGPIEIVVTSAGVITGQQINVNGGRYL